MQEIKWPRRCRTINSDHRSSAEEFLAFRERLLAKLKNATLVSLETENPKKPGGAIELGFSDGTKLVIESGWELPDEDNVLGLSDGQKPIFISELWNGDKQE